MSTDKPTPAARAAAAVPGCTCARCAVTHGDQAFTLEEIELLARRAEVATLRADNEWLGNVLCGLVFDVERHNIHQQTNFVCAYCGKKPVPIAELRSHMEGCPDHPLGEARAERDGARSEAAALRRDRDTQRAGQQRLLDEVAKHLGLKSGLELAEDPSQAKAPVDSLREVTRVLAESPPPTCAYASGPCWSIDDSEERWCDPCRFSGRRMAALEVAWGLLR